jgi:flagellar hook-length control protein FliK
MLSKTSQWHTTMPVGGGIHAINKAVSRHNEPLAANMPEGEKTKTVRSNLVPIPTHIQQSDQRRAFRSDGSEATVSTQQTARSQIDLRMMQQTTPYGATTPSPISKEDTRPSILNVQTDAPFSTRTDAMSASTPHSQTTPVRMDLPAHISRQIMDVFQHLPSKPVEISLNPEELGRLRLAVSTSDASLHVNVAAERPETLDLLRRHIAMLGQEFQALGYEDVSFSFNGDAQSDAPPDEDDGQPSALAHLNEHPAADAQSTQIHLKPSGEAGLDLRL